MTRFRIRAGPVPWHPVWAECPWSLEASSSCLSMRAGEDSGALQRGGPARAALSIPSCRKQEQQSVCLAPGSQAQLDRFVILRWPRGSVGKETDRHGQAAVVRGRPVSTVFGWGARGLQRRRRSREPCWPPSGRLSAAASGLLQGQAGEPQDCGGRNYTRRRRRHRDRS